MPVKRIVGLGTPDQPHGGWSAEYGVGNVLRRVAEEEADFDQDLRSLVQDLLDTMNAHAVCVGLAAPQIGVSKRVVVVTLAADSSDDSPELLALVNPKVVRTSGPKDTKRESCMSLPGWAGTVTRREKALVTFSDLDGSEHEREFHGFHARIVGHEIDHLDGVLYADHTVQEGSELFETDLFDNSNFQEVQENADMS